MKWRLNTGLVCVIGSREIIRKQRSVFTHGTRNRIVQGSVDPFKQGKRQEREIRIEKLIGEIAPPAVFQLEQQLVGHLLDRLRVLVVQILGGG